jgi:hypothetical protein
LNPGPSGEDAEVSANLAMSDQLFRAKAHGSADCQGPKYPSPDLPDLSSFDAKRGAAWRSNMPIHYIRPDIPGELRDPFDCDEQVVNALVTVGAFVALADGHIDRVERAKRLITSIGRVSHRPSRDSALPNSSTHAQLGLRKRHYWNTAVYLSFG